MKVLFLCLTIILSSVCLHAQKNYNYLSVPGAKEYTSIDKNNHSVLPSGRYITPAGSTIQITNDPFGIAISPDGSKSVTLHDGVITIIDNEKLKTIRVPSYDKKIVSPLKKGSFLGVTFAKNNNDLVYLSAGDAGAVIVYDINELKMIDSITLNVTVNGESFLSSLSK